MGAMFVVELRTKKKKKKKNNNWFLQPPQPHTMHHAPSIMHHHMGPVRIPDCCNGGTQEQNRGTEQSRRTPNGDAVVVVR